MSGHGGECRRQVGGRQPARHGEVGATPLEHPQQAAMSIPAGGLPSSSPTPTGTPHKPVCGSENRPAEPHPWWAPRPSSDVFMGRAIHLPMLGRAGHETTVSRRRRVHGHAAMSTIRRVFWGASAVPLGPPAFGDSSRERDQPHAQVFVGTRPGQREGVRERALAAARRRVRRFAWPWLIRTTEGAAPRSAEGSARRGYRRQAATQQR